MPANQLVIVRHARPLVDMNSPAENWSLSAEGVDAARRLALFLKGADCGNTIWSSAEVKAQQTAAQIADVLGIEVATEPGLGEVSRKLAKDPEAYREWAASYLRGQKVKGWEPQFQAVERFESSVNKVREGHNAEHLIIVSHGQITTLYLASTGATDPRRKAPIDPVEFWSGLQMPDAWRLDLERNWLDRIGFTSDGLPISIEPPRGAAVLVYRRMGTRIEFLLLHRSGQPHTGDWAWTPPAGARLPNEDIHACAARELKEEVGLELDLVVSDLGSENWPQFLAEADEDCEIHLSDEHDHWEWVEAEEACSRCLPHVVSDAMRRALDHLRSAGQLGDV